MKIQNSETDKMRTQAAAAEEMLKALANRHRLMILCQLNSGESSVGDLATMLGVRDSTVSQHLALLRKDGLVATRRDGQTIWYALASEPVRRLVSTLYDIYCGPQAVCAAPKSNKKGARRAR
ncbi:MAG: transcriptional regulator [Alphaproteobacteria bacterium 65-7]|nr:MAG: transcriptional regulator [Alphaproteobacteria bacterium 65-7]